MSAPTQLTISYGTSSTQTVSIPKPDGTNPQDFTQAVRNIFLNGGFWYVSTTGVQTFVPWGEITAVTAQ